MKKANEYTEKDVKRAGYRLIYSGQNLTLLQPKIRMDKRYNFSRAVLAFYRANQLTDFERKIVLQKRKERRLNKPPQYVPLFELPIVKDWLKNKHEVNHIGQNVMQFWGGRNHWAKNDKDRQILAILKKKFTGQYNKP